MTPFDTPLGPLRFAPRFKTAMWGGRRLRPFFGAPPSDEPTGEAWVLTDYGDTTSVVADGPLAGATLRELMTHCGRRILGRDPPADGRFPLLLKFIDADLPLSVQVHPTDALALELEGGGLGKTEAWVIVDRTDNATIFAGLKRGVTPDLLTGPDAGGGKSNSFRPEVGECVFLTAGTVHAIGAGVLLFEVQQSSDYTYRLYDWGRVEPATGKPRELHIDKALRCVDFCAAVQPDGAAKVGANRERLAECPFFAIDRVRAKAPFRVGMPDECKVLTCVSGTAVLSHPMGDWPMAPGTVLLLPAEAGRAVCTPRDNAVVLEVSVRGL